MRQTLRSVLSMVLYAYFFFLSIEMMGSGMKGSFKAPVSRFLQDHAETFTELASFVVGVIATSLVQSSSTVTSMAVALTQDGTIPLLISIGIVHGANLGTSVTSSLVAFASETRPLTGNLRRDAWTLLFEPRLPGFHRAVGTAVVHGLFNVILVTTLLITLELPFGAIRILSQRSSHAIGEAVSSNAWVLDVLEWGSPKTWAGPVVEVVGEALASVGGALGLGNLAWMMVIGSFVLLFFSLRGFARTVKGALMRGQHVDAHDLEGLRTLGHRMLGTRPVDTFLRGLVLTILVQSSSATTSMVVPLAALGLFSLRQVFPFIMGANIGTTTTAIIAASTKLGQPGFEDGMTIALCHFYLNLLAVVLVTAVPPIRTSVLGATQWLADHAERRPAALVAYLLSLSVGMPAVVYFLPNTLAWGVLGLVVLWMLIGPHFYLRRVGERDLTAVPQSLG